LLQFLKIENVKKDQNEITKNEQIKLQFEVKVYKIRRNRKHIKDLLIIKGVEYDISILN
jgi:hypothetical protein